MDLKFKYNQDCERLSTRVAELEKELITRVPLWRVQQMRASPQDYAQFVDEPYTNYLDRMARDGEWGDNVTLQAASDALNRRLQVLTDVPGADCIMVYPKQLRSTEGLVQQPLWSLQEPICIAFLTEWHYDAALVIKRPIGTIVHM